MMSRRGLLPLLAALAAAPLVSACGLFSKRASFRFRMTVEAQTPEGLRTGSSVMQVNAVQGMRLTSEEHAGGAGVTGEAVTVDLADGPVFVLLTLGSGKPLLATEVTVALNPDAKPGPGEDWSDTFVPAVRELGGWFGSAHADLPRESWPMMVRFRDLDDPLTVERLDPAAVGVRRIQLETTNDRVTSGISRRLPWLARVRGNYLHGGFSSRGAPFGLQGTAFTTEIGGAE
jgi:hypothetical protein